jgi:hypothetical protein
MPFGLIHFELCYIIICVEALEQTTANIAEREGNVFCKA